MLLNHLSVTNFKNIPQAALDFSDKVNCFVGNNGMGKTNLLDAIYALSFTKSHTGVPDAMMVANGEQFAIVSGQYTRRDTREDLVLGLSQGGRRRKSLKRGGKEYKKLSDHIGLFPLVMVSPGDADLVRGTAEERRRWIDMVISQSSAPYLHSLITYSRALEQRNRLLRDRCQDRGMMEAVEAQLCMAAMPIAQERVRFLDDLSTLFQQVYASIAGTRERVAMRYQSELLDSGMTMEDMLLRSRERDGFMGHTTAGPHRDDIAMTLDTLPMRRTGSEGQCKTFTIALRLAQYELMRRAIGMHPLLLLDDIFDRLDARRVESIIEMVGGDNFGQIFITDTNRAHLDTIMHRSQGPFKMWNVERGSFTPHD